jgi:CheY-like chemotaxis protein
VLISLLTDAGYDVSYVRDGRDLFWELAAPCKELPDVVVIDANTPVYDGLTVLESLVDPHVPAVILSSYPSEEVVERAESLGGVVLPKPFSRSEFQRALERAT